MKYKSDKLIFIDGLRGLLALAIVVWHYRHFYSFANDGVVGGEDSFPLYNILFLFYLGKVKAVEVFWVISGFVFSLTYLNKKDVTITSFVVKRLARLYPLHLFTLLLILIIQNLWLLNHSYTIIYENFDFRHFFLNLFMASSWGLEKGLSFNGPAWSVSVELIWYAVFWLIVFFEQKPKIYQIILFVIGTGLLINLFKISNPIVICGGYFFTGMFLYQIYTLNGKVGIGWLVFFVVLSLIIYACCGGKYFLINPIASIAVFVLVQFDRYLPSIISDGVMKTISPPLLFIGGISYGLYLTHVPVQMFMICIFDFASIGLVPGDNMYLFLYVFCVLLFSVFVKKYIEDPARKYMVSNFL